MTALAEQPQVKAEKRMIVLDDGPFSNLLDTAKYEHLYRVAQMFAASDLVPAQFVGKPANTFIALQMAMRMNIDPFMLMQAMYVVHGKPGIDAKMVIALVNTRGPFVGPIQWELTGDGKARKCRAFATHKVTGELCECTVDMNIVEGEGWLGKSGSKWKTMPDQMFRYRSAAWLARLYAPECLMGMQTTEELQDIPAPAPRKQVENTADRPDPEVQDLEEKIAAAASKARSAKVDSAPTEEPKTPETAKPVEPVATGEHDALAGLAIQLSEITGKPVASAEKAIQAFCLAMFRAEPSKITPINLKSLKTHIANGDLNGKVK